MDFYFSGVSSADELSMLCEAGVSRVLVDPVDLPVVADWPGQIALDCGAYRRFKGGKGPSLVEYIALAKRTDGLSLVTAYETIGAACESNYQMWRRMVREGVDAMPVYQWASPRDWLRRYLDEAALVGIGGMATLFRAKAGTVEKTRDLELVRADAVVELGELCRRYPGRFHLFGSNWLPAMEVLRENLASADTSKWLDGRRYRVSIFENTRTGHLALAPSRSLGLGDWDGRQLSVDNARNMDRYLNGVAEYS